jgi:hypothetical protein
MRMLWKLAKIVLVLAIAIPLALIALTTAFGLFGALAALAFLILRVTVVCLLVYGGIRFVMSLFGGDSSRAKPAEIKSLAPVDPHYEAAMRELDRELGERLR